MAQMCKRVAGRKACGVQEEEKTVAAADKRQRWRVKSGVKKWLNTISAKLAETAFVRSAIEEQANLSAFKEKPSLSVLTGVLLIIVSSLLGWPAVAGLGVLAVQMDEPLVAVIGCPLVYGFSHLVFLLGMYFSGAEYSLIFFRWLSRITVEGLLRWSSVS